MESRAPREIRTYPRALLCRSGTGEFHGQKLRSTGSVPSGYQMVRGPECHGGTMKRFKVYRPSPPDNYREGGFANAPDEVQFEGVEFTDGTVAVRWLTLHRSTSIWESFDELMAVHGHME